MKPTRLQVRDHVVVAITVAAGVMVVCFVALVAARPILKKTGLIETLCFVDRTLVFQKSAIGVSANNQLAELKSQLQQEINQEKLAVDQTADRQIAEKNLVALRQRVEKENSQLQKTRAYAIALVIGKIAPVIREEARKAECTAVLDRAAVIDFGSALDLTEITVSAINHEVLPLAADSLRRASAPQPTGQ